MELNQVNKIKGLLKLNTIEDVSNDTLQQIISETDQFSLMKDIVSYMIGKLVAIEIPINKDVNLDKLTETTLYNSYIIGNNVNKLTNITEDDFIIRDNVSSLSVCLTVKNKNIFYLGYAMGIIVLWICANCDGSNIQDIIYIKRYITKILSFIK